MDVCYNSVYEECMITKDGRNNTEVCVCVSRGVHGDSVVINTSVRRSLSRKALCAALIYARL